MVSSPNPAITQALNAPPLMKPGATAQAVEVTMLKKALDMEGQAALALIPSVTTGKGGTINVTA